jgi:Tn7-like transposition protein D/TniQ
MADTIRGLETRVPLLRWLPGETFYSLCSRHHRFSGHPISAYTTRALFGHSQAGNQHDFPSRLDSFVERVEGVLGDAEVIARQRTLLRFYAPFHQPSIVEDAVASMRSASVAHLKYKLGILTSRFRAHHPLKACRACMALDSKNFGWATWHLDHQFPGVWVCSQHLEPLHASNVKATGVERFSWQLPSTKHLHSPMDGQPSAAFDAHGVLSRFVQGLLANPAPPDGWLQSSNLQSAFRRTLSERGLMTPGGNVRLKEIASDYAAFCQPLRLIPELQALPDSPEAAAGELGRIVRQLRAGLHPLRLLTAGAWLFPDVDVLKQAIASGAGDAMPIAVEGQTTGVAEPATDDLRLSFVQLLRDGASVTSASATAGISTNTGLAWAAAAGLAATPRPKWLKPQTRAHLIALLRSGPERADAAAMAGVGVGTVDRLFQTEPELHAQWSDAKFARARGQARAAWLTASGVGGVKLARMMEPAAYAWLYRNDRAWLRAQCDTMPTYAPSSRTTSVLWDERDAVRLAEEGLFSPRLWQLYQVVPDLKAKLSRLDRLPLTRRVLEQVLKPGKRRLVDLAVK